MSMRMSIYYHRHLYRWYHNCFGGNTNIKITADLVETIVESKRCCINVLFRLNTLNSSKTVSFPKRK